MVDGSINWLPVQVFRSCHKLLGGEFYYIGLMRWRKVLLLPQMRVKSQPRNEDADSRRVLVQPYWGHTPSPKTPMVDNVAPSNPLSLTKAPARSVMQIGVCL